jgi:hypothetical protein
MSALALAAQDQERAAVSSRPEAEIPRLDREYHEARFRNDAAGVNRLLAPDYYAVTTNGEHRQAGNLSGGLSGASWMKVSVCETSSPRRRQDECAVLPSRVRSSGCQSRRRDHQNEYRGCRLPKVGWSAQHEPPLRLEGAGQSIGIERSAPGARVHSMRSGPCTVAQSLTIGPFSILN